MARRGGALTRRWLFYVAVLASWLLGAELMVVTTLGRSLPGRLPKLAAWVFVIASALFLAGVARWEVTSRSRTTRLVDQLNAALGSITELTEASLSRLPLDELLDQLLGRLQAVLRADVAAILLLSGDGTHLIPRAMQGANLPTTSRPVLATSDGLIRRVVESSALCETEEIGELRTLAGRFDRRLASAAACPITVEGRLIGICLAATLAPLRFDERELHLLQLVADRAGLGIERARLDDAERRSTLVVERARRHAIMLAAASDALSTAQAEYETNLAALVDIAVPEFADWCAIDLGDPDGTIRRLAIRHGGDGASARARDAAQAALCSTELSARVPRLADMVARACAGGGSERWSEAAPIDVDSHEGESLGPISCIVTPIRFDEAAFGAISFAVDPRRAGYEGADLAAAEDVARRAGIAVERARLYRTIHASEARWRVLVEAAPVGIVEVDLTGRVCWWNRAASALFGWMDQQLENATSEEQPSFPTEASAQLVDLLSDVSASAEVGGRDLTGVMTGGERRDLTVSAAPLLAADGTVQGILVLVADVTLHRRLETELRQAQRMEVIGQLAGGVAHEFNNLLTLIGGYTELLRRHFEGNERAGALIRDIHAATVRASVLTGQLLTVGRRRALHPVVLAPADEVQSLSEVLERFVPSDVQVSWSLDPASGRVRIDHGQFEQLILNLAINARDAMPDGGRLDIAVAGVELDTAHSSELAIPPGKYVRIAVADSGSGMDEETRLRCFEPLYTTKGPSKGTGLGLPAVRRVVLECGGAIRFDSELGRGTTFEVLLPRFDGDDSHDDEVLAAPIRPATVVTPGSGTVLLAEDDDDLRRLVCRVLSHNGYQVLEATSGAAALAIARRHDGRIDVLVSDVLMPGTGGHDLAIQLQGERPGLAVLLVSGSTDATVLSGLGSGPTGFLAKPFKPSDVIASVKVLLDGRSDPRSDSQAAVPPGG